MTGLCDGLCVYAVVPCQPAQEKASLVEWSEFNFKGFPLLSNLINKCGWKLLLNKFEDETIKATL